MTHNYDAYNYNDVKLCEIPAFYTENTGNNMNLMLTPSFLYELPISEPNAYIVAISEYNKVIGSVYVYGITQTGLTIYGNDEYTNNSENIYGTTIRLQLIDNSSIYAITSNIEHILYFPNSVNVLTYSNVELICNYYELIGCLNPSADNYNPTANVSSDNCIITGCMDLSANNYNPDANNPSICYHHGCTNYLACNYNPLYNIDDESCIIPLIGYDCNGKCIEDTDNDGICNVSEISGCTDHLAINYNIDATDDDGTCISIIYGCTYSDYIEYNHLANVDNGSCKTLLFDQSSIPADVNNDQHVNIADIVIIVNTILNNYIS